MKNDKKYWMKRRRYGWGWTPATWQGWVFIILQIGIIFSAALMLPAKPAQPSLDEIIGFFLVVIFALISLVIVSGGTSPRPRWRWGKKDTDDVDEDF
jgi:hypothetical protein